MMRRRGDVNMRVPALARNYILSLHMAKSHPTSIDMNQIQDGTYCSIFFISVPALPSDGCLREPCLGKRETAPGKHWVTEVCCWPVAPWLDTSTDIHRWRLVMHTVSHLWTAEWNWRDLRSIEEQRGSVKTDCGFAGAGWVRWLGWEVEKRNKAEDLVGPSFADVSNSDKHGYRCTSRCSIPQEIWVVTPNPPNI